MKFIAIIFVAALILGETVLPAQITSADKVPRMTKEQLKPLIGSDGVVLLDARIAGEWRASPAKIKGAIRLDPSNIKTVMAKLPKDKTLVFYCD